MKKEAHSTGVKDTTFLKEFTFNNRGRITVLKLPAVMGILNLTPDSFYDGGRFSDIRSVLKQVEKMRSEGMAVLDIGASSSRPGAPAILVSEELGRLIKPLAAIRKEFPDLLISIDTCKASVATESVNTGADLINDISGGQFDDAMPETVAGLKVPYILMHMQGRPEDMQQNPTYGNVVQDVFQYFSSRLKVLTDAGVHDIILDPGFGFGKNPEHNFALLKNLHLFTTFGHPVMAGISRKSMVNRVIGTTPESALNGTTVLNTLALLNGCAILRVHDVLEARQAIQMISYYDEIQ